MKIQYWHNFQQLTEADSTYPPVTEDQIALGTTSGMILYTVESVTRIVVITNNPDFPPQEFYKVELVQAP